MKIHLISFLVFTITATTSVVAQIRLLRPRPGAGGPAISGELDCLSWRLAVETDNIKDWDTVPIQCETYVGYYMLGGQYRNDSKVVAASATTYAKSVNVSADGKDVWVFDIDETTLSNLPYYANNGFGAEEYNSTSFDEWVALGVAPALPESLKLYQNLVSLGIKVVFLTGRTETFRNITITNLHQQGYTTWENLILKNGTYANTIAYKGSERANLVDAGYRIVGNMGDQWTDILGTPTGERTFKVPDPMYYIS